MRSALAASGALLIGFGILEIGDGLQGTLLGVRASIEGFSTPATGVVMSMFYVGFLGGCMYADRLVDQVGHVRVFAALASIASAVALIHAVFVHPATWALLRFLSGFCFAGLYVVTESWLNARADNRTRGQILSIYMVVTYLGIGVGQLMLNAASPAGYDLFVLTSVLISLALVPLLLSAGPTPSASASAPVSIKALYRISPLGSVGTFASGITSGALFGIGPVFAGAAGLSVRDTSIFMTAVVVGVIVLQWPIGHLSDRLDRRVVLCAVAALATGAALWGALTPGASQTTLLTVAVLYGGLSLPLYALSIAHANDYLAPEQIVAASAGLVLVNGLGSVVGPIAASAAMEIGGAHGFFAILAAVHGATVLFALFRMSRRPARPVESQGSYAPAALQRSQIAVEWSQYAVRSGATDDGHDGAVEEPRRSDP